MAFFYLGQCSINDYHHTFIYLQLNDHAKQYDNDDACHNKRNGGKLHGNISRNGYGNAIIGRYGGCFEEDIRRLMCDRAYRIMV